MQEPITPQLRQEFARRAGINEAWLYQCLTGRRDMGAAEAVRVERVLEGRLMRWHLCTKTWPEIWPELITHPDAPAVTVSPAQSPAALCAGQSS